MENENNLEMVQPLVRPYCILNTSISAGRAQLLQDRRSTSFISSWVFWLIVSTISTCIYTIILIRFYWEIPFLLYPLVSCYIIVHLIYLQYGDFFNECPFRFDIAWDEEAILRTSSIDFDGGRNILGCSIGQRNNGGFYFMSSIYSIIISIVFWLLLLAGVLFLFPVFGLWRDLTVIPGFNNISKINSDHLKSSWLCFQKKNLISKINSAKIDLIKIKDADNIVSDDTMKFENNDFENTEDKFMTNLFSKLNNYQRRTWPSVFFTNIENATVAAALLNISSENIKVYAVCSDAEILGCSCDGENLNHIKHVNTTMYKDSEQICGWKLPNGMIKYNFIFDVINHDNLQTQNIFLCLSNPFIFKKKLTNTVKEGLFFCIPAFILLFLIIIRITHFIVCETVYTVYADFERFFIYD